jgi:hypothetical protein
MSLVIVHDLGLLFDSIKRFPSPERLNIKCLVVGTGNQIQGISPAEIEDGMVFSVTADSDDMALREGVLYVLENGDFKSINSGTHTHMDSNDGGSFAQTHVKGMHNVWHRNYSNPYMFSQLATFVNGSAIMQSGGFLQLTANAGLANNLVNCYDQGLLYTFSQNLSFYGRLKLTDVVTNFMSRIGFNGDDVQTVTPTFNPQVIIEGCDSCRGDKVTIVTADTVGRDKESTPLPDLVTDVANYYLELIPSETKVLYKRNNTTFVTKDNFIPTSGVPSRSRLIHAGIQTKNTVAKKMDIYGFIASGTIGESNWNIFP